MMRACFCGLLAMLAVIGCSRGEDEQFISLPLARFIFYGSLEKEAPEGDTPGQIVMDRLQDAVLLANGTLVEFTAGAGSGLHRSARDPEGVFQAISGRGPTIPCVQAWDMSGAPVCEEGTVFALPEYCPTIQTLRLDFETSEYEVLAELPLRVSESALANGLPNDPGQGESAFSAFGEPLPLDEAGLDPEALVRLADGTYWLAEEYGPSLVHAGPDGLILERLVPHGREGVYSRAAYPVAGVLPAEYASRKSGGGFTALALDAEEEFLCAILGEPLGVEESAGGERPVRILVLDLRTRMPKAEYVYLLDNETAGMAGKPEENSRVTEAVAVNRDSLLVLEWMGQGMVYLARLREATNLLNRGNSADRLALEKKGTSGLGVRPAAKTLVLKIGETPKGAVALEAMSFLPPATIVVAGDSGSGLLGQPTVFRRINILEQQPLP